MLIYNRPYDEVIRRCQKRKYQMNSYKDLQSGKLSPHVSDNDYRR